MLSAADPPFRRVAALPVWRALLALAAGLMGMLLLRLVPGAGVWPPLAWALAGGGIAVGVARFLGLGRGWKLFLLLTPIALVWQADQPMPSWPWMALFTVTFLVFGGGVLTRVPLYNSHREAWASLEGLLPGTPGTFLDLGAGLGGPVAHVASRRPEWRVEGVEASPLVWLIGWLRCRQPNARMRLGSLWSVDLRDVDVAYAFLSPHPMGELWIKICSEMRPNRLFISHTFPVPGVTPERILPVRGRQDACLLVYRVPGRNQDFLSEAETP